MREDTLKELYGKIAGALVVATMLDLPTVVDYLIMANDQVLEMAREWGRPEEEAEAEEEEAGL